VVRRISFDLLVLSAGLAPAKHPEGGRWSGPWRHAGYPWQQV